MKIVRYASNPRELAAHNFGSLFGDLFSDFFERKAASEEGFWPRVDIEESAEAYTIKAELPGVEKEELNIEVNNNVLTLSGEKREEKNGEGITIHRKELFAGSFQRSFSLPEQVDTDAISANFRNGVVAITIPKSEKRKVKKIEING